MRKSKKAKTIFINAAKRYTSLGCVFAFLLAVSISLFAQSLPKPSAIAVKKVIKRNDAPAEKSIAVDARVNVKLCVAEGRLKINGWDRNEIRAFVAGGDAVNFKVLQKGKQNGVAVWVAVVGYDDARQNQASADECLSGDEIELDVPRGAAVNVKSRESETSIDSVARATIENLGGSIYFNNVAHGIEAKTYEGDITVERSGGAMSLQTTNGNIVAFGASPSEIGDAFKAKTNSGAIVLRQIEHRQIEANSTSGALRFAGEFLVGGQYTFNALNGSINLQIPQNSAFKLNAFYGVGAFNSDFALTNIVKSVAVSKAQNISAQIGSNAVTVLNLSTYSGIIQIKKQ